MQFPLLFTGFTYSLGYSTEHLANRNVKGRTSQGRAMKPPLLTVSLSLATVPPFPVSPPGTPMTIDYLFIRWTRELQGSHGQLEVHLQDIEIGSY
ncbi:hypothetical protein SCHPADRAFT_417797 [Schizopora paradoxa]|uniref:Uncharacterized protein n=1 Tax=Schizopora paradoxa TaxID=27342 RepID=A0A0H2RLN4_9AGAM|nr:hypothetical protein SCHPADRAFT_417797 [Schizopora paradoxa]